MTRDVTTDMAPDGLLPQVEPSRSRWPGGGAWWAQQSSMTGAVADLRATDHRVRDEAARRIWERFAPRLCALARSRLSSRIRVREDENDIVQSMFQGFFAAHQTEESTVRSREELWRLLVWMTLCKVANAAHYHQRARRDVRRERSPSSSGALDQGGHPVVELAQSGMLSPEVEVISRIELERMLLRLREDLRQIVAWKLEGYTNKEIGEKLHRTERTVELKMQLIREIVERDPWVSEELALMRGLGGLPDR